MILDVMILALAACCGAFGWMARGDREREVATRAYRAGLRAGLEKQAQR